MTKAERRARTDQRIKAAATQVFAERGYERAAISSIASLAGISNGLIIQNFGGKLDLFKSILDDTFPPIHELYATVHSDHWEDYLTALIHYLAEGIQNPDTQMKFRFTATMALSKDTPAYYREKCAEEFKRDSAAQCLVRAQQRGEIKDGRVPDLYALFFRNTCTVITHCSMLHVELPEDEWFLQLLRK